MPFKLTITLVTATLLATGNAFSASCGDRIGKRIYSNGIFFYSVSLPRSFEYRDRKRPSGSHGFYGNVHGLGQLAAFATYPENEAANGDSRPDISFIVNALGLVRPTLESEWRVGPGAPLMTHFEGRFSSINPDSPFPKGYLYGFALRRVVEGSPVDYFCYLQVREQSQKADQLVQCVASSFRLLEPHK